MVQIRSAAERLKAACLAGALLIVGPAWAEDAAQQDTPPQNQESLADMDLAELDRQLNNPLTYICIPSDLIGFCPS